MGNDEYCKTCGNNTCNLEGSSELIHCNIWKPITERKQYILLTPLEINEKYLYNDEWWNNEVDGCDRHELAEEVFSIASKAQLKKLVDEVFFIDDSGKTAGLKITGNKLYALLKEVEGK